MLLLSRSWMVVGVACLSLAWTGCQPKTTEKPAEKKPTATRPDATTSERSTSQAEAKGERKAASQKSKPQEPSAPLTIPEVTLSEELRAACIVNTGDTMPEGELPGPDGKPHALNSLFGEKLTVVCFWTLGSNSRSQRVATAALQDLMNEVAVPFGEKGVSVIGVNVGDAPAAVDQTFSGADATFPNLLDPKGEFFAKLAKDRKMPRVYLLDAEGRILWFDVEFGRNSRWELVQSIRAALGKL